MPWPSRRQGTHTGVGVRQVAGPSHGVLQELRGACSIEGGQVARRHRGHPALVARGHRRTLIGHAAAQAQAGLAARDRRRTGYAVHASFGQLRQEGQTILPTSQMFTEYMVRQRGQAQHAIVVMRQRQSLRQTCGDRGGVIGVVAPSLFEERV